MSIQAKGKKMATPKSSLEVLIGKVAGVDCRTLGSTAIAISSSSYIPTRVLVSNLSRADAAGIAFFDIWTGTGGTGTQLNQNGNVYVDQDNNRKPSARLLPSAESPSTWASMALLTTNHIYLNMISVTTGPAMTCDVYIFGIDVSSL